MLQLQNLLQYLFNLVRRHPRLVALFGFISGATSLFLVERKESLAQFIAIGMLASWLWLALENVLRRGIAARFGIALPPPLLHFVTQMVHQESLFFVLPFFLVATTWASGQAAFTTLLMLAALISLIDPLYYRWLARRRWLYLAFHSLTLFAVLLVALPILLRLTTGESYRLATIATAILSFPSLSQTVPLGRWWRVPILVALMLALGALVYVLHRAIPPATLRLAETAITRQVVNREPGPPLSTVSDAALRSEGLIAYTAIRAPRGLHERIYHLWVHEGEVVDRIPLEIDGGREQGYRAWSRKQQFPSDAIGVWQIKVVTEGGQLVGVLRFRVGE